MREENLKLPEIKKEQEIVTKGKDFEPHLLPATSNQVPTAFGKPVDLTEYNPLKEAALVFDRVTDKDTYPTNMDLNVDQHCFITTEFFKMLDGPNGDKKQYIGFLAYSVKMCYNRFDLPPQVFILQFPWRAFREMLYNSLFVTVDVFAERYPNRPLEIVFKKVNKQKYELLFLAVAEWTGEGKEFRRLRVDYDRRKNK